MAEAQSVLIAGWRNRQCSRPHISIARISYTRHRAPPLKDVEPDRLGPWDSVQRETGGSLNYLDSLSTTWAATTSRPHWMPPWTYLNGSLKHFGIISYFYRSEMEMEMGTEMKVR